METVWGHGGGGGVAQWLFVLLCLRRLRCSSGTIPPHIYIEMSTPANAASKRRILHNCVRACTHPKMSMPFIDVYARTPSTCGIIFSHHIQKQVTLLGPAAVFFSCDRPPVRRWEIAARMQSRSRIFHGLGCAAIDRHHQKKTKQQHKLEKCPCTRIFRCNHHHHHQRQMGTSDPIDKGVFLVCVRVCGFCCGFFCSTTLMDVCVCIM